jgi:hypothetical protein
MPDGTPVAVGPVMSDASAAKLARDVLLADGWGVGAVGWPDTARLAVRHMSAGAFRELVKKGKNGD